MWWITWLGLLPFWLLKCLTKTTSCSKTNIHCWGKALVETIAIHVPVCRSSKILIELLKGPEGHNVQNYQKEKQSRQKGWILLPEYIEDLCKRRYLGNDVQKHDRVHEFTSFNVTCERESHVHQVPEMIFVNCGCSKDNFQFFENLVEVLEDYVLFGEWFEVSYEVLFLNHFHLLGFLISISYWTRGVSVICDLHRNTLVHFFHLKD